jgi:hypothetical protein
MEQTLTRMQYVRHSGGSKPGDKVAVTSDRAREMEADGEAVRVRKPTERRKPITRDHTIVKRQKES